MGGGPIPPSGRRPDFHRTAMAVPWWWSCTARLFIERWCGRRPEAETRASSGKRGGLGAMVWTERLGSWMRSLGGRRQRVESGAPRGAVAQLGERRVRKLAGKNRNRITDQRSNKRPLISGRFA
jgi:hypothetical protein